MRRETWLSSVVKTFFLPNSSKGWHRLVEYLMYSDFFGLHLQMWQLYDGGPACLMCPQFLCSDEKRSCSFHSDIFLCYMYWNFAKCIQCACLCPQLLNRNQPSILSGLLYIYPWEKLQRISRLLLTWSSGRKTGLMDSQWAQRCPPCNAICHISMTIPAFPWLSN